MALPYSARLRRWMAGRPGFGLAAAAWSSSASSQVEKADAAAGVGVRQAGGRHFARTNFAKRLLERAGVGADVGPVDAFQHDAGGLGFDAMAANAVLLGEGGRGDGALGSRRLGKKRRHTDSAQNQTRSYTCRFSPPGTSVTLYSVFELLWTAACWVFQQSRPGLEWLRNALHGFVLGCPSGFF